MPFLLSVPFLLLTLSPLFAAEVAEIAGGTMGTTYSVKWVAQTAHSPDEVREAVERRLAEINALMSTYDPESELSRFNRSSGTEWFPVSPETARVVARGLEISELSGGAFDMTVGKLVRMWSFGGGERTAAIPSDEEIAAALETVGYQLIQVRTDPPELKKERPGVELELSAIAKGYAVDEVSEVLGGFGIGNSLTEIGGEVVARGTKNGRPWRLGIEKPDVLQRRLHARIELSDEALATSGDYRNFYEEQGVRYSHIIDPKTGRPVRHQLASVSVLADDCMTADALATTLLVLGPEEGIAWAEEQRIAAYFLVHDGEGVMERASSPAEGRFLAAPRERAEPPAGDRRGGGGAMETFLLTAIVFAVALLALAVGAIFANRPIRGTCGGAQGLKDERGRPVCDTCSTPPEECEEYRKKGAGASKKQEQ